MKNVFQLMGMLLLALILVFVSAWGYQVVWNDVVLNIWQLFSSGDVVNTMRLSYGVFVVIALSTGLVRHTKSEKNETKQVVTDAISKVFTKLVLIGFTLFAVGIVF